MKNFDKFIAVVIAIIVLLWAAVNTVTFRTSVSSGKLYIVEIKRIENELSQGNEVSADSYETILGIYEYDAGDFYNSANEYVIREINGRLYRIEYSDKTDTAGGQILRIINFAFAIIFIIVISALLYVRQKIIKPFNTISELPYELSKGNLTVPVKENKNRFFGRFLWGIDMLRENIEQNKQHGLELQREKKTLLLSLSHDLKTPLSAIKLYAKALSKGLYQDTEKQQEIAESINSKADEIEKYVSEIIGASREDFLNLEVHTGEFYLSEVVRKISDYYGEKLSLIGTDFYVHEFYDCLLKGDSDRSVEVIQNVLENAIKYGDGKSIEISFSEEDNCRLVTVKNSGCTLPENELPHIFESFWRGSNIGSSNGNGLGLYICRQLMNKMGGEIFAEIRDESMAVTVVFVRA